MAASSQIVGASGAAPRPAPTPADADTGTAAAPDPVTAGTSGGTGVADRTGAAPSAEFAPTAVEDELIRANAIHDQVVVEMRRILASLRQGRGLEAAALEPLVGEMLDSFTRCPDALLLLSRLQTNDDYLLQHSIAVSVLLMQFGHGLGLTRPKLRNLGLAGLLHDIGHCRIPGRVNNKGGKLNADEYALMQQHVDFNTGLLSAMSGVTPMMLEVAQQHHERYDGSGYPQGLAGEQIGRFGQMAGIVDVYEAMTALRPFHRALSGTDVLRMLYEWGKDRFSPALVQSFIATVGIYPTGSLVRLRSDRLGIVLSQHPSERLRPRVKVIYSLSDNHFLEPRIVDLLHSKDQIVGHESYEHRGLDPRRWVLH